VTNRYAYAAYPKTWNTELMATSAAVYCGRLARVRSTPRPLRCSVRVDHDKTREQVGGDRAETRPQDRTSAAVANHPILDD